jgi:hypothetical protein
MLKNISATSGPFWYCKSAASAKSQFLGSADREGMALSHLSRSLALHHGPSKRSEGAPREFHGRFFSHDPQSMLATSDYLKSLERSSSMSSMNFLMHRIPI